MKMLTLIGGMLLAAALSGNEIAARQDFFRKITEKPALAQSFLQDKDPEIRRYALYVLLKKYPEQAQKFIVQAINDPNEQVRLTAIAALAKNPGLHQQSAQLLKKAARADKSVQVRRIAVAATWPFHREIKLLRNDPTWDYEVKVIKTLPLEKLPWVFTADPLQEGHLKGFHKTDFDTSGWSPIKMGSWEQQGFPDYDGTAWYQIKFVMPEKMDCNAVEIAFDAVDESAWIWLNGIYLGCHDIGPEGWNKSFAVDCSKEIRWGKENILTIRVHDEAFAGGIYKPLRVEILK